MDCIFCKIVAGEIPASKVWENEEYLAILDIHPNTKGMTLIISKTHFPSNLMHLEPQVVSSSMLSTQQVVKKLERAFDTDRIGIVVEGMGVDHLHIKLYPMHGVKDFQSMEVRSEAFFDRYPGYITTQLGPQADLEELERVAELIRDTKSPQQ